jgi:NRPS condensation-like uncharacterized protein
MRQIPQRFPTRSADRALAGMLGPVTCVIQLEMGFEYKLDEKRLERAVSLLTGKLPLLGCRFVPKNIRPFFERLEIEKCKLFHLTFDHAEFEAFRNERMDFFNGPQIETCLHRSYSKDRFLIKVSHLVCDASGAKEITGELSKIYNQLKDDPDFKPEPDLADYRGFWQILRQVPWYAIPRIFYNYICEIYGSRFPTQSHAVPMQKVQSDKIQFFTRHIDKTQFSCLNEYAKEKQTTVNDILTTAIIRALSKTGKLTPGKALRLGMAVDMRRYLPGKKAKSIANFSSLELFNYGENVEKNFESTLIRVAKKTNERKSSWLGLSTFVSTYPMLWTLPFSVLKVAGSKGWEKKSSAPNSFDWLTNMGVIQKEKVDFDGEPSTAWFLAPGCVLPMLFFGCSSYNGTLTFSWSTGQDEINEKVTQSFFNHVFLELPLSRKKEIIASFQVDPYAVEKVNRQYRDRE